MSIHLQTHSVNSVVTGKGTLENIFVICDELNELSFSMYFYYLIRFN
jgi:hypothetical protein